MTVNVEGVSPTGFVPPSYPYDRLGPVADRAAARWGEVIDLSIGTPVDPPSAVVLEALSASRDAARRYPPSVGTVGLREAYSAWMHDRLGVDISPDDIGATVGAKEFVAGLAHLLALRDPSRDTVLFPSVSYPSYAMGATLGRLRAVPVPTDEHFRMNLAALSPDDVGRALCLWVNSPANPTGVLEDLEAAAEWGRGAGVPVFSDECYVEFTWEGPPSRPGSRPGDTIVRYGTEGVVAVHSLSKRSNLAGVRVGCYAGDPTLVEYLREVRKHMGLMVAGPAQLAGIAALADQPGVEAQAERYRRRLVVMRDAVAAVGVAADLPAGAFYLWARAGEGDGWTLANYLADSLGIVVSPGEFYSPDAQDWVRVAVVGTDDQCATVAKRAAAASA